MLTRRDFFCALAASVVAAKMPLPTGFPAEPAQYTQMSAIDALFQRKLLQNAKALAPYFMGSDEPSTFTVRWSESH